MDNPLLDRLHRELLLLDPKGEYYKEYEGENIHHVTDCVEALLMVMEEHGNGINEKEIVSMFTKILAGEVLSPLNSPETNPSEWAFWGGGPTENGGNALCNVRSRGSVFMWTRQKSPAWQREAIKPFYYRDEEKMPHFGYPVYLMGEGPVKVHLALANGFPFMPLTIEAPFVYVEENGNRHMDIRDGSTIHQIINHFGSERVKDIKNVLFSEGIKAFVEEQNDLWAKIDSAGGRHQSEKKS